MPRAQRGCSLGVHGIGDVRRLRVHVKEGDHIVRTAKRIARGGLALVASLAIAGTVIAAGPGGSVIYDSTPHPLPPNLPSLSYQATQTAEFGDQVEFAGVERRLLSATVTMSAWALASDWPAYPAAGWQHPITLNLYDLNTADPTRPGTLIGSVTQTFDVPWRPAADPTCPGGTAWRASDGSCYNGYAFNITFDLSASAITVPDEVVFGIAYNTQTWGASPIGVGGPYNSLNVGVTAGPSVGVNADLDDVFWNTSTAGWYADGGANGVGEFRQDTVWAPYQPAVSFSAGFPTATTKNACKGDGWKALARSDGSTFKNQGDCIQYVNTGK